MKHEIMVYLIENLYKIHSIYKIKSFLKTFSVWDFLWTKWHCGKFSEYLSFPLILLTHLLLPQILATYHIKNTLIFSYSLNSNLLVDLNQKEVTYEVVFPWV